MVLRPFVRLSAPVLCEITYDVTELLDDESQWLFGLYDVTRAHVFSGSTRYQGEEHTPEDLKEYAERAQTLHKGSIPSFPKGP